MKRVVHDFASTRKLLPLLITVAMLACFPAVLRAQSQWQIDVVDGGAGKNVGKFTSLTVDRDGNLHVGYYDETRQALRYGFRGAATAKWYTMEVDASGGAEAPAGGGGKRPHVVLFRPH